MSAPLLALTALAKSFGAVRAVAVESFVLERAQMCTILGPSGCGKTTLLRLIAGLEDANAGSIMIDGVDVTSTSPEKRPVNLVFQSYALFPHMDVAANVGYGLKVAGTTGAELAQRVGEALELVRLQGLEQRKPNQLSGGQQQRVALARALVMRPRILLLDEPLSSLDANLRAAMRDHLSALRAELDIAFVMVTHDRSEALSISDRLVYMAAGAIVQAGSPAELYARPVSQEVASFLGEIALVDPGASAASHASLVAQLGAALPKLPAKVTFGLRPSALRLAASAPAAGLSLPVTFDRSEFRGESTSCVVRCADGTRLSVLAGTAEAAAHAAADELHACIGRDDLLIFDERGMTLAPLAS